MTGNVTAVERRQHGRSGTAFQLLRIHTRISPGSRFAHR